MARKKEGEGGTEGLGVETEAGSEAEEVSVGVSFGLEHSNPILTHSEIPDRNMYILLPVVHPATLMYIPG